jgi:hypothetical protein
MHTYRELILGAYLASYGFRVRYGQQVGGKTPDWCILDEASALQAIVELVNLHVDKETEVAMDRELAAGGVWCGLIRPSDKRLYDRIATKAAKYKELCAERTIPFAIALFTQFTMPLSLEEVLTSLLGEEPNAFSEYPEVSGVLFFRDSCGKYHFDWVPNPRALRPMALPSGAFGLCRPER